MKRLLSTIAILTCLALSLSRPVRAETTLEDLEKVRPLANGWSSSFYLQGGRTDSGLGIGIETPSFHSFGFRLSHSFEELDSSSTDFSFNVLNAAVKLQLVRGSSEGIVPYFLYAMNWYTPVKNIDTGGSKNGTEFGFGTEWRYNMLGILNDNTVLASIFLELLKSSSSFASAPAGSGGIVVHDGALGRLGFRTFF